MVCLCRSSHIKCECAPGAGNVLGSALVIALLTLLLASCGAMVQNPVSLTDPRAQTNLYPQKAYKIQVGDELEVRFFYNPELNDKVIVRPDGYISLQLVGELKVLDMSPGDLTSLLQQRYDAVIQRSNAITVTVRGFAAQRIYVDGEVNKPGLFPLTGQVTVLQAIALAGGYKDTARLKEIILIRRGPQNEPLAIPINLEEIINNKNMSQDVLLLPFDVVFLPKSKIANVNKWVQMYIKNNLPINPGFGYYYSISQ
jgi:polysaccharide export outer membrane protein